MQLLIVNRDHHGYTRGDILSVLTDVTPFGPLEVAGLWLSHNNTTVPDEYRDDLDDPPGTFPRRTVANFPNPWSAVARFPSYRCDLNLTEHQLEADPDEPGATRMLLKRLWYVDLDALPPGQRNSLEQPGGEATLGAVRLSAIKNRFDGSSVTDVVGWEDDITLGNSLHRHADTGPRNHM